MATLSTGHEAMIHDAQMDYYGKRLASCSSDHTIRLFDVVNEQPSFTAELRGHQGPVWQVGWAHPKFGNFLVSCSYDRKVIVWKEVSPNQWTIHYEYCGHEGSVNSVVWGPHQFGLAFACASSDGFVSVVFEKDGTWTPEKFEAHKLGVNSVSWAPPIRPGALVNNSKQKAEEGPVKCIVTAGCDETAKIWRFADDGGWTLEDTLAGHKGWVRDAAWAPSVGLPSTLIATCGQDQTVIVWTKDDTSTSWVSRPLLAPPQKFDDIVWRVSWSVTGGILAVSCGNGQVTLWKESLDGHWNCLSGMDGSVRQPSS